MAEYLGHLGFLFLAMAYWVKDLLLLRTIALVGFSTLIVFNYHVGEEPNWVAIYWNLFFIVINASQAAQMIYQRKNVILSDKEKELYERLFSELSEFEFAKLIRIAKWKKISENTQLIKSQQVMNELYFIYHGVVEVAQNGCAITDLRDGQFIGEMSFFSRNPASADVTSKTECDLLIWEQNEIRSLLHRNPSLFLVIQSHMGKQLSEAVHTKNQLSAS